jgi:hypothetical protein
LGPFKIYSEWKAALVRSSTLASTFFHEIFLPLEVVTAKGHLTISVKRLVQLLQLSKYKTALCTGLIPLAPVTKEAVFYVTFLPFAGYFSGSLKQKGRLA